MSLVSWTKGVSHDVVSIRPDYVSCLYGVAIYAAFVVRFKGVQQTVRSWVDIGFCILLVLLLASFIKTILVTKTLFNLFGWKPEIDTNVLLLLAVILSWVGLKLVSLGCLAAVAVFAISNVLELSQSMGIWGPVYIISAFIGIMMYASVEPVFMESVWHTRKAVSSGVRKINSDVLYAKQRITGAKGAIQEKNKAEE